MLIIKRIGRNIVTKGLGSQGEDEGGALRIRSAGAISSLEAFGLPIVSAGLAQVIAPVAVASLEGFGRPRVDGGEAENEIAVSGGARGFVAWPKRRLPAIEIRKVGGIESAEAFGVPTVERGVVDIPERARARVIAFPVLSDEEAAAVIAVATADGCGKLRPLAVIEEVVLSDEEEMAILLMAA